MQYRFRTPAGVLVIMNVHTNNLKAASLKMSLANPFDVIQFESIGITLNFLKIMSTPISTSATRQLSDVFVRQKGWRP